MPAEVPSGRFMGVSNVAHLVRRMIQRAARNDCTVLITGESGVGKELVAQDIHEQSSRSSKPFVTVNCSAISDTLVESEFFGHERGAFTDARESHRGAFERADGGMLFLDEVGDLSPVAQPKLLRALESGEVLRVGGERTRNVDVRFIAATNQNLPRMCRTKAFRSDLYYRLRVVEVTVPPLRDRAEDIPLLTEHFAREIGAKIRRPEIVVPPESLERLSTFQWPGNVRQLRSAVERAVAMSSSTLLTPDCFELGSDEGNLLEDLLRHDWRTAHDHFERIYVEKLLKRHEGRVEEAAESAGLATGSLYKIIRRLEIDLR